MNECMKLYRRWLIECSIIEDGSFGVKVISTTNDSVTTDNNKNLSN